MDGHYRTLPSREKRAITGLSMGGHGALWLAIRHQDVFGAAGSTSGGLDIRPFPDNWDMKEQIGQKMPGCAIGTIIPSSTRRANSRMVPYGLFLIAAMMISSLKSTKLPSKVVGTRRHARLYCASRSAYGGILEQFHRLSNLVFLEILQRKSLTVTVRRVVIWSFAVGERISFSQLAGVPLRCGYG